MHLAPLPTANLFPVHKHQLSTSNVTVTTRQHFMESSMYNSAHSPCGDHLTQVAARLILKITREGFHAFSPSLYTHT